MSKCFYLDENKKLKYQEHIRVFQPIEIFQSSKEKTLGKISQYILDKIAEYESLTADCFSKEYYFDDGVMVCYYYGNEIAKTEKRREFKSIAFFKDNYLHREGGEPAHHKQFMDGTFESQRDWAQNGSHYRENKRPQTIYYKQDIETSYFFMGDNASFHHEMGASCFYHGIYSYTHYQDFFLNDIWFKKHTFFLFML